MEKGVTLEVEGAQQGGRSRKMWKEVADNNMNDLH